MRDWEAERRAREAKKKDAFDHLEIGARYKLLAEDCCIGVEGVAVLKAIDPDGYELTFALEGLEITTARDKIETIERTS